MRFGMIQRYFNFLAPGRIRDAMNNAATLPARRMGLLGQERNIFEYPRWERDRRETVSKGTKSSVCFKYCKVCIQAE